MLHLVFEADRILAANHVVQRAVAVVATGDKEAGRRRRIAIEQIVDRECQRNSGLRKRIKGDRGVGVIDAANLVGINARTVVVGVVDVSDVVGVAGVVDVADVADVDD